jgi:uncharacterized protein YacL
MPAMTMTSNSTANLFRWLFIIFCLSVGSVGGESLWNQPHTGAMIGVIFSLTVVLVDRLLKGFSLRAFSSATVGLLLGYLFASLLRSSEVLRYQPEEVQWIAGLALYTSCAYLGAMLALRSNRDEFSLIIPYVRFREDTVQGPPILLDSSAIIDGRLRTLSETGFLGGSFLVPEYVVEELQALADSADLVRREKGRRGLDYLNELKAIPGIEVSVVPLTEGTASGPVDARLVVSARALASRILTTDANLAKVARLQGIRVLNLNELQNSLRPELRPGDEVDLAIIKEGRDPHQGVGFLPDGSMVVVNQARPLIGRTARVVIAGHTQTSAGRLLFGEVKPPEL